MIKRRQLEEELNANTRAFILMIGYGAAKLFRDLNKRFDRTLQKLKKGRADCQKGKK